MTLPDAPARAAAAFAFLAAASAAAAPDLAFAQAREQAAAGLSAIAPDDMEAQLREPVALVADSVSFDNVTRVLVAEGNVEVYQGDRTLTADRITYDSRTGRIEAEGEITLRTPEGVTLIADFARLDDGMREALIESARMQLPGNARFAARSAQRIDGRYNVLGRAVFSPCEVCAADPTPLWRIRARRIVHDQQDKVIHYEDAFFDVMGVTVAWLPYFRHPDPTVERASGVLFPRYLRGSSFGHAVKLPVHWVIDDASDATFTPFVTEKDGVILEAEYRRVFEYGAMTLGGSIGYADYDGQDRLRGHVDAAGRWAIGDYAGLTGWEIGFEAEIASDDAYLARYDFSERDRLTSEAYLAQSDERGWMEVSAIRFQSLRDDEPFGTIPMAAPSFEGRRRVADDLLGGALHLSAAGYALKRTDGQDAGHVGIGADWERSWVLPVGVELRAVGMVQGDAWRVADPDPGVERSATRLHPQAGVEARYPLFRRDTDGALASLTGGGATHVITPIVQFVAAPYHGDAGGPPNEDSSIVEFDETNLFSLRRHSGWDGVEEGPRFNIGLQYALMGDDGTSFTAAVGQVRRFADIDSFGLGAGLDGSASDFVGAWSLSIPEIGRVAHRMRLTDDLELDRNEVYAAVEYADATLAGSYIYLNRDAVSGEDRHEAAAEGWYRLSDRWSVGAELRRDLEEQSWVRTQGMLRFANECADFEFQAGRRFTGTDDAPPSTYVGLRVRLRTLSDESERSRMARSSRCAPQIARGEEATNGDR